VKKYNDAIYKTKALFASAIIWLIFASKQLAEIAVIPVR
jgi:hypothetical protein